MNAYATKSLIAAASLAIAGSSAFAFETIGEQYPAPSKLSRAEVKAELARARAAGEIVQSSQPYSQVDTAILAARASSLSRAQVQRELAQTAGNQRQANEAYGTVAVDTPAAARQVGSAE